MSVVAFIVIALAFGISSFVLVHRCAEVAPVRLSSGLLSCIVFAAVYALLFWLGGRVGGMLSFESSEAEGLYNQTNAYILLGLYAIVIFKMLSPYLRREPKLPLFSMGQWSAVLAMSVASGIDVFLVGIGTGFVRSFGWQSWLLFAFVALLAFLGLMYGRQKVALRPRRWIIVTCVLLLGVAVATAVNAG